MTAVDVPAHVQHSDQIQNNVQVQAGTNWDVTRSARSTPIVQLPDPEPVVSAAPIEEELPKSRFHTEDVVPEGEPLCVIHFTNEGITLTKADQKELLKLPKDTTLFVAAHGDAKESDANRLSRVRGKAVTTFLRGKGYKVEAVKSFGSTRPAPGGSADANQAVEIFAVPVKPEA